MLLRKLFSKRALRSTIACGVALLQIHLFWLTVFHHHEDIQFPLQQSTFGQASQQLPPAADAGVPCTACQIVRNSAMRPTVTLRAPQVAFAVLLLFAFAHQNLRSFNRIADFGRAPPLT